MVSGGADSVFLFHTFANLKRTHDLHFEVIHFHHGIRQESDEELQFVKDLCAKASIPCQSLHLDVPTDENFQNAARQLRYDKAWQHVRKRKLGSLVTAHHQDDLIETLVMKASRGTGMKGLRGLTPKQSTAHGDLLRPLLALTKSQIVDELKSHNLPYREDVSNQDTKYFRTRVRQHLEKHPLPHDCAGEVLENANWLTMAFEAIHKTATDLAKRFPNQLPEDLWQSLPNALLQEWCIQITAPWRHGKEWTAKHFSELQKCPHEFQGPNTNAWHDHSGALLVPQDLKIAPLAISESGWFENSYWRLSVQLEETGFKNLKNKSFLTLSAGIKFPLSLELADLQTPVKAFGSASATPLKEIFRARGVGQFERRLWPVLKDSEGQILAIPGVEITEQARVLAKETQAYRIDFELFNLQRTQMLEREP